MKKIPHSRSIPQRVQYGSLDKGVLPPAFETDHLTLSRAKHRLSSYLYLFAIFRNSVVLSEGFPSPSGHRMLLTVISLDDGLEFWVPHELMRYNTQQTTASLKCNGSCWILFLCLSFSLLCFVLSSFHSNRKNEFLKVWILSAVAQYVREREYLVIRKKQISASWQSSSHNQIEKYKNWKEAVHRYRK